MTDGADIEEEFEKISTTPYDSYNGPLWRVQLQYEPNRKCSEPELVSLFPYEYTLIVGSHHGITDGHSMHKKLSLLLNILNDILDGKPVNDDQFGFHTDSAETSRMVLDRKDEYKTNPNVLAEVEEDFKTIRNSKVLWNTITNDYKSDQPQNLHITRVLDAETNLRLYQKFKSLGASFHAGFCSIADVAIVEMLKNSGYKESIYNLCSYHTVNARRYWADDGKDLAFGNNYCVIPMLMSLTDNTKSELEKYIKAYHDKLLNYLNNKRIIDKEIFPFLITVDNGEPFSLEDYLKNLPPPINYYVTSNMRDTTSLIGTGGNQVQLTWYTRSTSMQISNYPSGFMFQTYRKKLMVGFDYNTRYIPTPIANEFLDRIFDMFRILAG